ncbi:hypothetical protein [Streptomyces sp. NPDC019507]
MPTADGGAGGGGFTWCLVPVKPGKTYLVDIGIPGDGGSGGGPGLGRP